MKHKLPFCVQIHEKLTPYVIKDNFGYPMAYTTIHGSETVDIPKFIVKACNNHYKLVEICKEALRMYQKVQPADGWQKVEDSLIEAIQSLEKEA